MHRRVSCHVFCLIFTRVNVVYFDYITRANSCSGIIICMIQGEHSRTVTGSLPRLKLPFNFFFSLMYKLNSNWNYIWCWLRSQCKEPLMEEDFWRAFWFAQMRWGPRKRSLDLVHFEASLRSRFCSCGVWLGWWPGDVELCPHGARGDRRKGRGVLWAQRNHLSMGWEMGQVSPSHSCPPCLQKLLLLVWIYPAGQGAFYSIYSASISAGKCLLFLKSPLYLKTFTATVFHFLRGTLRHRIAPHFPASFRTIKLKTIYLKTEPPGEAFAWAALISLGVGTLFMAEPSACWMDLLGSFCDMRKGKKCVYWYQI